MDGIYFILLFVYTGRTVGIAEPTQLDSLDPDSFGPLHLCHPAALLLEISFIKGIIHHQHQIFNKDNKQKAKSQMHRVSPY